MARDERSGPHSAAARLRGTSLVGRETEIATIAASLDEAASGSASTLIVLGEPGVGKSRLCDEAQRLAKVRRMSVLPGRATERASAEPFHAWAEALARGFPPGGPPRHTDLLPLLPTLGHLVPAWSPPARAAPSMAGVCEAILRLLSVTSQPPGTLLTLEDLHWADGETLAVAEYVAANLRDQPVCCLFTVRSGEPGDAERLARRLGDTRAAIFLDLPPLDHSAVHRLVLDCLGQEAAPEDLVSWIAQRADGNPFLVEELLAGLERAGALVPGTAGWHLVGQRMTATVPATLAQSITRRYRSLSSRTQDILSAAALLGRRFDWRYLTDVTGSAEDVVLASMREASFAGLLVSEGDEIRFRHALTCDEVRRLTLGPQRSRLARRALDTVERAGASGAVEWRELAADLAVVAEERRRAARHLLAAAEAAHARGALSRATSELTQAAELAPGDDDMALRISERLAMVRAQAGDVDGAFDLGFPALAARRARRDDPAAEIDLEVTLARAALAAGRYDDARKELDIAEKTAVDIGDRLRGTSVKALAAEVAVAAGQLAMAERLAAEVLEAASEFPHDEVGVAEVLCTAHEVRGRCERVHDVAEAEASFLAAYRTADRHGLLAWRARALHELGTIDLFDSLRIDRLTAARHAAVEAGAPATEAMVDFHLSAVLLSRGDAAEGRTAAERSVALSRRLGLAVLTPALIMLARSYAQERRRDEMDTTLAEATAVAPDDRASEAAAWSHARTMLALHDADRDQALAAQDLAADLLRAVPGQHDPHRGLWALLRTVAGQDGDQARTEAAGAPGSDTRFNRAMLEAAAAVDAGRHAATRSIAARKFDAAVATIRGYESADWLVHLTSWLVAPAALADGWGDPAGWLDRAVRWFGAHGYDALATSCRVLLREAGGSVPRRGRGTSPVPPALSALGVTSREVDVLRMLARRLTNRRIAEELVLSPRTVEKHVTNLMLKTGCGDRAALAAFADHVDVR